jgi:glycosyltransferase involved in cell wall biosynthesis
MTAYNREKHIFESIDSLIKSTYQNWELIILDDCSEDNTFKIAKKFETEDTRIKAFKNSKNLGQFKNRNEIVKYASGKYLKYLDSDDLIYPHGLEVLVYFMEKFPDAGYGLCSLNQHPITIYPIFLTPRESYQWHYLKKFPLFHKAPLSSIIKKDVFEAIGGFPHEAVSGDFAMWNLLAQKHSVVLMPQGIVWYREHAEQEMQKTRDSYLVEFEYFKVQEYYLKHDLCPLIEDERKRALVETKSIQNKYIFWKLRTLGPLAFKKLYKSRNEVFVINTANNQ